MFTPSPRFICFIEIMKPFTKRLVCSTRRPDDTRASRCSILLPICLTKTKRHEFASNITTTTTTTTTTTIIIKVAREKKERKRETRERGYTRRKSKNSLSTRVRRGSCAAFYLSEVFFRGDAEFTSPAVADTLFRRTRGRRRRKRSHERVADDTLPISRYFSTAQSEP